MERRMNLLFGIIGGLFLVLLQNPLFPYIQFIDGLVGVMFWQFVRWLSFIGFAAIVLFSFLLILDTLKFIIKK